jgi:NADH-quinone oxidoreductase subunit M
MGHSDIHDVLPLLGAVIVQCLPREKSALIKWVSVAATVPPLLLAIWLFVNFDRSTPGFQFMQRAPWIPSFNIQYIVGVDGISITMVLLTALLSFLCILASWGIEKGVKGYFALFLLLDTGMMGVFIALDFFLFFVFWEVMLLPMYFLIGIWGGPRREYAAIKFFLYTLFGSALILLSILAFYFNITDPATGQHTFNMITMMNQANHLQWLRTGVMFGQSCRWSSGWRCSSASRSKFPPSRSIPGCPTRTSRRRPRSRSSSPACCSRWAPTASCASTTASCPRRRPISPICSSACSAW